jgi:quinol monooxygenase YgiN
MKTLIAMLTLAGSLAAAQANGQSAPIQFDPAKPVVQIATAKVKPGTQTAFKAAVEKILKPTRAEAGSISYNYLQSAEDPTEFIFIEVWKSSAAIDLHMNTEFIQAFFNEVGPLFAPGYPVLKKYQDAE